ncbi:uncharacterized protein RHOBADRAFT_45494 [Rhodotorula graminis WP1]|uniref:Uncharacterized protein n=1 Tax=Rhodotorula graminis (strain WP1) TaxID=578459 RepID=A0A0N8PZX4_RHOGW|nr:uncharacterized protein RHOBADRAFT_45494 [Rhodotorula graminis WP1]KPV73533.1 hypothetical protein RHOBADRAFT_45494 [Rhodotorula graminis WP1]
MSSRGSPIPRELADPPSSPFQPVLARTTAARRPVVRRPAPPRSTTTPDGQPTRPSTPFGEIGKENDGDDDKSDVLSLLSSPSGWAAGGDEVDDEAAAFLPRVRDLRQRRPVVRKRTVDVGASASSAAKSTNAPTSEEQEPPARVAAAAAPAGGPGETKATVRVDW